MSAPDTNIDRQAQQHKPALLGIKGAALFGALMIILMIGATLMRADDPNALSSGATETSPVALDSYTPGTNQSN